MLEAEISARDLSFLETGRARPSREMVAIISQFGTPEDLLLDNLKIARYFPTDDVTITVFQPLAGAA